MHESTVGLIQIQLSTKIISLTQIIQIQQIQNILQSMIKQLALVTIVSLLLWCCPAQPSCHILCNCTNSVCTSCYDTFQFNSTVSGPTASTCPCPQGFYSVNSTCLFCQDGCKVCADLANCLECLPGYTKINGSCLGAKYPQDATWLGYQVHKDFTISSGLMPSVFGFALLPTDPTVSSFYLNCSSLSNNMLFGVKSSGNLTLSLLRTYLGLPYHQWAHISLKYAALDNWNGQKVQISLYMDTKLVNKTYSNALRSRDICAGSQADSIDQVHSYIPHEKQSLAINITIPANVTLALHSIKLDVGTCPRNCLSCSGPTSCLQCKDYFINVNGICQCNTTLSHVVSYGCLPKCQPGWVFINSLERCVLCSIYLKDCYKCSNSSVCELCNNNAFISNGLCVTSCPAGSFPKKSPDNTSQVPHCHPCPANCTSCFNETVCINCQYGLYLDQGSCLTNCSLGSSIVQNKCFTVNSCPAKCATCVSNQCTECQLGFWMWGSSCVLECPSGTYQTGSKTCLPCLSNCSQCVDSLTCQACLPSFTLRNGTCQYYSTSCPTKYYFDARVRDCVACPEGCLTCFRFLCYTCQIGSYLDNGACLTNCSLEKFKATSKCLWKNELCQQSSTTSNNTCTKCRSLDYVLALDQSTMTCNPYCPSNITFSPRSLILTQNSRFCNTTCRANCQICINPTICIKCVSGFVLSGMTVGSCVSVCQSGYVSDSVQCIKCPFSCSTCDIGGNCLTWTQTPTTVNCSSNCTKCINSICVVCSTGFFLDSNNVCQGTCAVGTFADSASGQCRKCAPQCSSCTAFSKCDKCIEGYFLFEDACLRECPVGKYHNQETLTCDPCYSNCRSCFGPKEHQCLTCYPGSKKDHSQCVISCPVHKYQDVYGSCDWCHESCRFCFGPAQFQCLECDNSNYLYRGECYTNSCPAATFLAISSIRECQDCSWGCASCTTATTCQQCFGGFYLNNGKCLDVCPLNSYYSYLNLTCIPCSSHCSSCISSSCYQCEQNYSLYNGTCISTCPNSTFQLDYSYGLQCRACSSQCLTCDSAYQCTSCVSGLVLRNGQCTKYCEMGRYFNLVANSCRSCDVGCASCTAWGCNQCQLGYYFTNGQCSQSCPAGTYPLLQIAQCGDCPSTCLACSTYYQCTQCKTGYSLINGVCKNSQDCTATCQQCADQNNCLVCKPNYYRFTNSSGAYCLTTCPDGTYLYADMQCAKCQLECLTCTTNGCIQCQTGLILFAGRCVADCYPGFFSTIINGTKRCQACSPVCQACTTNSSNCIACSSPTAIPQNGTCVQRRQCLLSAFYSQALGYCVPCTAYCKICHNPTECDECLPNYFKTQGKLCRSTCPNGTYSVVSPSNPNVQQCMACPFPCLTCQSADQCSSCYAGYPFNATGYKCQTHCLRQTGYFANPTTNTCQKCNEKCLQCVGTSTSCTKCSDGYYNFGGDCIMQCPEGTFAVALARSCLPCGQYCQRCTSQVNCQICQPWTVTFNGSCMPVCPAGYYKLNGGCLPCVSPCRQCSSGSNYDCSVCDQGYYFLNNRCTANCPQGYYKNLPTSSCQACPSACKTCISFTSCQSCISPYTLNTQTQQCQVIPSCPTTLPNCQSCITNTTTNSVQCSSCFNNLYLLQGQCISECNQSYFENRMTGKCEPCEQNCTSCGEIGSCNGCITNFYLFNGQCYPQCPAGTYFYVDSQSGSPVNTCRIDPCIHYSTGTNSSQQCTVCVPPYLLSNGQCISVCPAGTYQSELSCQPCRTGCSQCVDLAHCTKCQAAYHFYVFDCRQDCPAGTYSYIRPAGTNTNNGIQDGQCIACNVSCLTCTSSLQCSQCSAGYFLTPDGKCTFNCPTGFYPNPSTQTCSKCSPSCTSCTSVDFCQRCASGTYLLAGQCVSECPQTTYPSTSQCIPCSQNCMVCSGNSNCSQCQSRYKLNRVSGQCVRQCPTSTYVSTLQECQPCNAACATCITLNQCTSCSATAILFNGNCITTCPSGYTINSGTCIECDSYCRECTNVRDNCTSCQQGYLLENGYCRNSCPSHTFRNPQTQQCQSCSTSPSNGRCSQCYGLAVDQCLQCYSPYYLFNNVCVSNCPDGYFSTVALIRECKPCDSRCLACSQSAQMCTKCPWGYYLVAGSCLPACPAQYYANPDPRNYTCLPCESPCRQCDTLQSCTTCVTGFYLTPVGTCVANCSSIPSLFLNTNTSRCQPCSQNCQTCTSSTECSQCVPPYRLYLGQCIRDCPSSTYPSTTNSSCQPCTETFCSACTSATQCTECLPGRGYLHNGDCVPECPVYYVALDGKCVVDNENGTNCAGYWLNNSPNGVSQCVQFCPYGYYPTTVAPRFCFPCSTACLACSGPTDCQTCSSPYKLVNNSCVNVCPTGYVELNQICVKCDTACRTCTSSATECTTCQISLYLFNSQCVQVCPDGYYADSTLRQCIKCAQQCAKCSSLTQCQQCKNTRYTVPSCTDNVCPSGQYKVESTGQCANCDTNCLTCSGGSSSNCLTCRSPLFIINGQCRSSCPPGFVVNTANNTCIPCPNGCKTCNFYSVSLVPQCVQCFQPKILNNGNCLQDCTSIQTETSTFTTDGTACFLCPDYCLECNLLDLGYTSCTMCKSGYILYMGQCVSNCPASYYPIQNSCQRCPQNCLQCSSLINSCTNCTNSTYVSSGTCVTECPSTTYADTLTFKCLPCTDPFCIKCSRAASSCQQCVAPFNVDAATSGCKNCLTGYLYNTASQACEPCEQGCLTCSLVVSNCTSCDSTRALIDGRCVEQCPQAYYLLTTGVVKECKKCPANCLSCQPSANSTTTLNCFQCRPGYYHDIATHQCLPSCPSNTYITNSTDCTLCPSPCLVCSSATDCGSCASPYYKLGNKCVNTCPGGYVAVGRNCEQCSTACINCTSSTNCTTCRSDYYLTTNRTCEEVLPCPVGKYADSTGACQSCATNCLACTSLQSCTKCALPYLLLNGLCNTTCLATQYSITVTESGTSSRFCVDCLAPCQKCVSNTTCTSCLAGYFLTLNGSCVANCGYGYFGQQTTVNNITYRNCTACADPRCKICTLDGCRECTTGYYLFGLVATNMTNGTCVSECPSGYYKDNQVTPLSCKQCTVSRCDRCDATQCQRCLASYSLLVANGTTSCEAQCPNRMINVTINNVTKCEYCQSNCLLCRTWQWCTKCDIGYYLFLDRNLTVGNITNYNTTCVRECPPTYFKHFDTLPVNNSTCEHCETNCANCTNETNCTQCISDLYVLQNGDCIPYRCLNCTNCVNQHCTECQQGFYLYEPEGRCYERCPDGYWGSVQSRKCEACMENCAICPTIAMCDLCKDGFNFTGTACVNQAFVLYGSLSNMSGFTSNITKITSVVYLGTSIGPMVFGQMTSTYFNIEFCQFILFHAKAAGNNSEMQQFLGSLQSISLTTPADTTNQNGTRRLLATSLSDPNTFLATSAPIFAMMGGFLAVYIIIVILEKNMETSCLSCPRFKFYVTQICAYMKKRFKWIYFDFVAWISFLPFTYFSLMQLQKFSFATGLEGFSCILSIIIIVAYPLYPFFICYLLRQNYNELVQQNNQLVEMSLSPYVFKVKRPTREIMAGQPIRDYFNAQNFRLIYDPLKYFRKFLFVLVVALCHQPITSLIILIILNVIFIIYMAVFRPRVMPYMIFDFIVEGVLLFFEIFMLVYLTNESAKVTTMSIATHAVGFITANLSLIIAIILNLIAYYKIFMCIYDMYQHLKTKVEQKEKADMKDEEQVPPEHENEESDLPEKEHHPLAKSLRGTKRKSNGDDVTEFDSSENHNSGLIKDKEIFGNGNSAVDSELKKSKGGLPDLKATGKLKKKSNQPQFEESSTDQIFVDKQLPKRQRVRNDDQMTESNPDSKISKIESGILKDKQLYKGSIEQIRHSIDQIPDLKASHPKVNKQQKKDIATIGSHAKLRRNTNESDQDFMNSRLSGQEVIAINDGKIREQGKDKFKRSSLADPNQVIVSQGVPIANVKDKYRRNLKELPRIDSINKNISNQEQQEQNNINELKTKEKERVNRQKEAQIKDMDFFEHKNNKKSQKEDEQIQQGSMKSRNILNVPMIGKNTQGRKPDQSIDLLEASFASRENQRKNINQKEDPEPQSIKLKERNKSKEQKINDNSEEFIEGGTLIQHRRDKFRRGTKQRPKQDEDSIANIPGAPKKKNTRPKDQQDEDVQDLKVKAREKKKKLLGQGEQNSMGDEYERRRNKEEAEKKAKRGRLGVNQNQNEQYDDIRRKNQQNMFSPDKGAASLMLGSLDVNDFDDSDYESRPESKIQRPGSRGKGVLGIDDNASAHDSEDDNSSVRRQRIAAVQKLRKKQGNLDIGQRPDYSGDDSASSRPEKKEKRERKRREKSGILQVNKRNVDQEGMESIQLEKNK